MTEEVADSLRSHRTIAVNYACRLAPWADMLVALDLGDLQELKEVVALAKKRKLKPLPIETRPAAQANAALEDLKAGRVVGRVVLDFETVEA